METNLRLDPERLGDTPYYFFSVFRFPGGFLDQLDLIQATGEKKRYSPVNNCDIGAGLGQRLGKCVADASVPAGDDDAFILIRMRTKTE